MQKKLLALDSEVDKAEAAAEGKSPNAKVLAQTARRAVVDVYRELQFQGVATNSTYDKFQEARAHTETLKRKLNATPHTDVVQQDGHRASSLVPWRP